MTRLIKWLIILCFTLGFSIGMLSAFSIEKTAQIKAPAELSADEIKLVKHFIKSNNPLNVKSGEIITKEISQQDLDVLLNYITLKTASGIKRQLRVKIDLEDNQARLAMSLAIPETPLGEYLNLTAIFSSELSGGEKTLQLKSLKLGRVNIPVFLMALFSKSIEKQIQILYPEYELIKGAIKTLSLKKSKLLITYTWTDHVERMIKTQIGLRLLSAELKTALLAHWEYLAGKSHVLPKKTSLNHMINTMFIFAKQRSEQAQQNNAEKHNALIENKAAFIALGGYVLKRDLAKMLGKKTKHKMKFKRIYLNGKHDLSKHFLLSAAIASMADSEVAESFGVIKEVRDAKNGSGFSFRDLAADHAGIRLVQEVLKSEQQARKYQKLLAEVGSESDYMLEVKSLPEGIVLEKFEKNYANIESEAYLKMKKIIQDRIDELPIYNR